MASATKLHIVKLRVRELVTVISEIGLQPSVKKCY